MASDGIATVIYLSKNFVRAGRAWNLYRIAQEAVNNAITHGRGRRIDISLGFGGGKGLLRIRDDGIGIPERVPKGKGIGLHTMNYRCRLIGASVQVQRRARRGTVVTCAFRPTCRRSYAMPVKKPERTRLIAQRLHLSFKTIESHREHIKQKLTLKSGAELVRRAIHWVESGRTS